MGKVIWLKKWGDTMDEVSVFDVAKCFLSYTSMTHKKLQKLCYYAQAWHLALIDKPLFNQKIEAWIHGPVVPELYHEYKEYGWKEIPQEDNNDCNIEKKSLELIDEIYNVYGDLDGDELEILTHDELPWREARKGLGKLEPSHNEIENKTMRDYYLEIYEKQEQND